MRPSLIFCTKALFYIKEEKCIAYIKLYFAIDDSEVSAAESFDNAVEFTLRADLNQTDETRLYALAETDYVVTDTTVTPTRTTAAKWALADVLMVG